MLMPSIFRENLFDDFFNDLARPVRQLVPSNQLMKTDIRETDDAFELDIDLPGFKKENVYVDFKDNYLNVYATRGKNWKDVLVPSKDGVTYEPPVEPEKDLNTKEIKNICYVQKQSKDRPIEEQHIFVDVTKHNSSKREKKLEDGILTIHIPSREETKPALLTFNE